MNTSTYIDPDYYIFDDGTVRGVLFTLYTLVFIFCFFGNLMVVVVMTIHWKMRSITKFCIGNLAFANMCVGFFCVYQNFFMYIIGSWPFGNFFCKMFHFVNSLSHTASILILVVISVERYLVILHPFKCRRILTIKRLRLIILGVWLLSGILSLPRLLYVVLIRNPQASSKGGKVTYDVICSIGSSLFASETLEMVQFLLLFLLPLLIISILYYKVGMFLRKREAFNECFVTSTLFEYDPPENSEELREEIDTEIIEERNFLKSHNTDHHQVKVHQNNGVRSSPVPNGNLPLKVIIPEMNRNLLEKLTKRRLQRSRDSVKSKRGSRSSATLESLNNCSNCRKHSNSHKRLGSRLGMSCYGFKARDSKIRRKKNLSLTSRRKANLKSVSIASISCQSNLIRINFSGSAVSCQDCGFFCCHSKISSPHRSHKDVIKLLVIIVVTFAVCNFPFHLRKIYQSYFYKPEFESDFDELATPVTFLMMYANCAINPIVYAFMSKSFRSCLLDVLRCNCRRPCAYA